MERSEWFAAWWERSAEHGIVHAFAVAAAGVGAGMAELPISDAQVLTSLQAAMVLALAERYGVEVQRTAAAELVLTLGATMVGRGAARGARSRWPGASRWTGAMTAAAVTEAIGWAAVAWFRERAEAAR